MARFGDEKGRRFGSDAGRQRIQERRDRIAEIRESAEDAVEHRARRRSASAAVVELPTLDKLERKLKRITSADDVRAMQEKDERKGAAPMYEARLAELEGDGESDDGSTTEE